MRGGRAVWEGRWSEGNEVWQCKREGKAVQEGEVVRSRE